MAAPHAGSVRNWLIFILPSLLATIVFYYQMLVKGGADAGFLYTGDVLGYFWPGLAKLHQLFWQHDFIALDFSSYNASSAFLLTANLFNVHPFVVIPALVVPAPLTFLQTGYWLVLILVLHSFIASYYAHRLMCDYFGFSYASGVAVGIIFAFSFYSTSAMGEPPFTFSIAILPWAAHSALRFAYWPDLRRFLWACLPVMCGLLGGYGPLGLASAGLAAVIVAFQVLNADDPAAEFAVRVRRLLLGLAPIAAGGLLLSPYLLAVLRFNQDTLSAGSPSLFFSAHQLAESPESILRVFSSHYSVAAPYYEFTPSWGFPAIFLMLVFMLGFGTFAALGKMEQRLFYLSAALYVFSVLAIYGTFSPVSNLIFNFAPVVGKMHIYQRFLYATSLFYAVLLVLALKAIDVSRPPLAIRIVWLSAVFLTLAAAYLVARNPAAATDLGLNGYIVFELMLASLLVGALLLPSSNALYVGVLIVLFLPPLGRIYTLSQGGNTLTAQRTRIPLALNHDQQKSIVDYIKRRTDKPIVKYVDMTPFWSPAGIETFPKAFPYFVLNEITLSSYGGFSFYLSAAKEYMAKMPVEGADVTVRPDWELVRAQGGDFVVAPAAAVRDGALDGVLSPANVTDALALPNDALLVSLDSPKFQANAARDAVFDNGYFRIRPSAFSPPSAASNVALHKPVTQSSGSDPGAATDGNTDGDFTHGSVTHSGKEPGAWLQVDLGSSHLVDSVTLWSRTDCCQERLRSYWLLLSDQPFPAGMPAAEIARQPGVHARQMNSAPNPSTRIDVGGYQARYIRVQLASTTKNGDEYLSLAELQVFQGKAGAAAPAASNSVQVTKFTTNSANFASIDTVADKPFSIDYLLWANPNLRFQLNGAPISPVSQDGVSTFNLPAGKNRLSVIYKDGLLSFFWVVYAVYFLLLLLSFVVPVRVVARGAGLARDRLRGLRPKAEPAS